MGRRRSPRGGRGGAGIRILDAGLVASRVFGLELRNCAPAIGARGVRPGVAKSSEHFRYERRFGRLSQVNKTQLSHEVAECWSDSQIGAQVVPVEFEKRLGLSRG